MKIIIGLGNPGKQYENTRHNSGFMIVDELQVVWNFPSFQLNKKFNAEISEGIHEGGKVMLVKPQTFMNQSGLSIQALIDFYKVPIENMAVLHDDLDIKFGDFKVSLDASAGGHNGILSIIEKLGTQKFKRIRIGIEGPELQKNRLMSGSAFVLQKFSEDEIEKIKKLSVDITKNI